MNPLAYLWQEIGIEWYRVPVIVLSAMIIYVVFIVLVRAFGPRIITVTNGFDALVLLMLGSVCGRAILGEHPTVFAGIIALATLLTMEAVFGAVERTWAARHAVAQDVREARSISAKPVLVFAHGKPVAEGCAKTKTSDVELAGVMRRAGVSHPSQVQCIVLEPQGTYSLVRVGQQLDPALFVGVQGAKEHLFTAAK